MLKPVQRIPQYRLLFEEYLKCLSESSPDYVDTQTALAVVANVAAHANATMKQGNNFMKLLALQDRLSSSSSGDHDSSSSRGPRCELVRPGRYLLKEGELLKLCRREMQPSYQMFSCIRALSPVAQVEHSDSTMNLPWKE
ncbi:hypothetical protein OTU49_008440 [Cherax quadricarinatus]|uniref:DH domain-containing protein n=1 Tax=Cherax quadricarinatus TaxID=27406 RepID=A0AAW0WQT3_CHEQU